MGDEILLQLAHPGMFREHILRDAGCEALFVPGYAHVPAGSEVAVRVAFPAEEFRLRGRVMWRRTLRGGKRTLQTGVGVAWLASQEEAVRRLYAYVDAPQVSIHRRQNKRHHAAVKVRYGSLFSLAHDLVQDVSLGGLRISAQAPAAVGQTISLYLRPPRTLFALKLQAEIVWIKPDSYGVRFTHTSARDERRLAALIERLTIA